MPDAVSATTADLCARLRIMVEARACVEGRTDSLYPGLRYYRFSRRTRYSKTQRLMPGLVVVLQGRKIASLGAGELSYDAMNYLVLGGETLCLGTVVEAQPDRPYLAIHLDLPPDTLVDVLLALAEPGSAPAPAGTEQAIVAPIDRTVLEALARLLPAADDATDRRLIAPLVVEEIIVRLLRTEAARAIRGAIGTSRTAARIQQAMRFIHGHFSQALSLEQLAAHVAMSPSHFAHRFRAIAGVSPMRYLRQVRLDQARSLLLESGMRAQDAAAQTGFESPAHFTREFKRRFGASPTEYVRRLRLGQD